MIYKTSRYHWLPLAKKKNVQDNIHKLAASQISMFIQTYVWRPKSQATRLCVQQYIEANYIITLAVNVPYDWPSMREIRRSLMDSPHKGKSGTNLSRR